MSEFIKVDAKHYVITGISSGEMAPFYAIKRGKVLARRGKVGEEVVTYTDGGLVEKVDKVEIDLDTGLPNWVLMKANDAGYPIVDEYGHVNEWTKDDSDFQEEYNPDSEIDGVFVSVDGPQLFVPVLNDIILVQRGEEMAVKTGGYLNITDLTKIYGISERDFRDTYRVCEDIMIKKTI